MKKILVLVLVFLNVYMVYAQKEVAPGVKDYKELLKLVVYPEIARQYGMESKVIVAVYIDSTGQVSKSKIIDSPNPIFDQAAIDAVMNYDGYTNAIQDGKPVSCWLQLPISFRINSDGSSGYPTYDIIEYDKEELNDNIKKAQKDFRYFGTASTKTDLSINKEGILTGILPIDSDDSIVNEVIKKAIKNTEFSSALQNGEPVDSFINLYLNISLPDTDFEFDFQGQPIVMNYQKDSIEKQRYAILKEGIGDKINDFDSVKIEFSVYDKTQKEVSSEIFTCVYGNGQINKHIEKYIKNMKIDQEKLVWLSNDIQYKVGIEPFPKDFKSIKHGNVFVKIKVLEINPK